MVILKRVVVMKISAVWLFFVYSFFFSVMAEASDGMPKGWQTWSWNGNCYAIVYASGPDVPSIKNGDTYIAVKHVMEERNFNKISIVSGFGDVTGIKATLEIGGVEFPLLVYGNAGYVRSGDPEKKLLDMMAKFREITVTWYKDDGLSVQNYNIDGFASAKKIIDFACPHQEN